MTSEPEQDWHTLFRQRRELAGIRDKALGELNITDMYVQEGRRTVADLGKAIERAEQACKAVITFDNAHTYVADEDDREEDFRVRRFMNQFRYR